MRTRERKRRSTVIERCRAPAVGVVTDRTIHREAGGLVVWICRGVVILRVTGGAICRRPRVFAPDVTLRALQA